MCRFTQTYDPCITNSTTQLFEIRSQRIERINMFVQPFSLPVVQRFFPGCKIFIKVSIDKNLKFIQIKRRPFWARYTEQDSRCLSIYFYFRR